MIIQHLLGVLIVCCLVATAQGSSSSLRQRPTNTSTAPINISRDLQEVSDNTAADMTDCEKILSESNFEFSQDMIGKILRAAELSSLTYSLRRFHRPPKGDFDTMQHFMDMDDASLIARHGNVCYAAFRGTFGANPSDVWQMLDHRTKRLAGCRVRRGFYRAYFAQYYNRFMNELEDCMGPEGRELVLTGHSQGGSNAMIAYLDLQHFNPTVFSFGAMRAYLEKCDAIDSSNVYRFNIVGDGVYDGWSNCDVISGVHMGHSVILAGDSESSVTYLGLDEDEIRSPSSRDVHDKKQYLTALQHMMTQSSRMCSEGPVLCRGWEDGHWCTLSDECLGSCDNGYCRTPL